MGKILKGIVQLGAVIIGTAIGGPIGGLIAGTIAGAGLELAFPTKRPKRELEQTTGRLFANIDLNTPRKMVLGRTAYATDIRFESWDNADDPTYFYRVIACAAHKVVDFEEIWFETEKVWTAAGGVIAKYAQYLDVQVRTEGNSSNTITIGNGAIWGSDDRLTGCAYVYLRYRVKKINPNDDNEVVPFQQNITNRITIVGKGGYHYDPRLDTTAGGSGTQRADDQSTWAYVGATQQNNLALHILAYFLGWKINGKLSVGKGIPKERIDMASFITAANICEELVALNGGGSEPRYTGAAVVSEGDDPSSVLAVLTSACAAYITDAGGKISIRILVNDLATPVATFTDDDFLEDYEWVPYEGLDKQPNIVRGRYTNATDEGLWQPVPYPEATTTSLDGIDRIDTRDYVATESSAQAERLAYMQLQRYIYSGVFTCSMKLTGFKATIGDIVAISFSPLGFNSKLFRVVGHRHEEGKLFITFSEEHADIYAWAAANTPLPPVPAPQIPNPFVYPIMANIKDAYGAQLGLNLRLEDGSTVGYDADLVTIEGTSAAIIGQGILATKNTASWVSDVSGRPPDASITRGAAFGTMHVGGFGNVRFTKNMKADGSVNDGEIGVLGNRFYHPDGTTRTIISSQNLYTPFELTNTEDPFFIIYTDEDPDTRFGTVGFTSFADYSPNFFPAVYDPVTDVWRAVDNSNIQTTFTPRPTDCIVAVGRKYSTSGGIDELNSLIGVNINLPEDGATVGADWAVNLSSKPTELVDGRVANALTSAGKLASTAKADITVDQITDGPIYKRFAATEKTKLIGIEDGATVGADWYSNLLGKPALEDRLWPMTYADTTELQKDWVVSNPANVSLVPTDDSGGQALEVGDNSGNDYVTLSAQQWFEYDPNSLYEITWDIEFFTSSPNAKLYAGVAARDKDGNNLGASYNYVCFSATTQNSLAGQRLVRKAYVKGYTTTTTSGGNPAGTPTAPVGLPDGSAAGFSPTVRFAPVALLNYNGEAGKVRVHNVRVRKLSGALAAIDQADLDTHIVDGSAYKRFSGNEQTKLLGIETGANVTETRISAGFQGQGALATRNAVDLATSYVLNKTAAYITETTSRKWAAESDANVTETRISAGFAGQGALATKNTANLDSDIVDGSTYKRFKVTESKRLAALPYTDLLAIDFDYADANALADMWYQYNGLGDVSQVFDAGFPGGQATRIGNNSGNDQRWMAFKEPIPFDPTALYEVEFWARQVSGAGKIFFGLAGFTANRTTLVNAYGNASHTAQHYVTANRNPAIGGIVRYVGYVQGTSSVGTQGERPDPTNPGKMHTGVRYIAPLALVNYASQDGECDIGFARIRRIDPVNMDASVVDGTNYKRFSGNEKTKLASVENNADLTVLNPTGNLAPVFKHNSLGEAEQGEFPRNLVYTVSNLAGQITSGVTWQYKIKQGTVNGNNASSTTLYSMSGTGSGTLTINSLGTNEALVEVRATVGSKTVTSDVVLKKEFAAPNNTGGSGSEDTASQTSGFSTFSGTTFSQVSNILQVDAVTTTLTVDVGLSVRFQSDPPPNSSVSITVECKVQRRINGGTWTDMGATVSGIASAEDGGGFASHYSAFFSFQRTETVSATDNIEVRVLMRTTSGTSTMVVSGSLEIAA